MTDSPTQTAPDAATARKRFKYIPALDGMRGFWVVFGPLLYHARPESVQGGPDILPGGILGVDMFFVLSSYLITGIALNEIESTDKIDLVAYAGRRVRRLFPALFALIAFLAIYLALSDPELVPRWTGAMVSSLLYVANWYEIGSGVDYFEQWNNPSPLKHVWSFSIEEQFYLFAPLFIIGLHRWFPTRFRQALLVTSVAGALLSAWWMSRVHTDVDSISRAYYGTDTRAQAFFVGIAMAVMVRMWGPVRSALNSKLVAVLAYPATIWFFWAVTNVSERDAWMFDQGGFLLAAVMSAIILHGLSQDAPWSPLHRIFESRPFIYVGRISYGLYLYHWPVYLLVTRERASRWTGIEDPSGYVLLAIHLTITFAVAITSFHLIEQPFTKRRFPWTGAKLDIRNGALAGSIAIIAILGGLLWANSDRPNDIEQVIIEVPVEADEVDFGREDIAGVDAGEGVDNDAALNADDTDAPRILVVGDSVMAQIGWALHVFAEDTAAEIVVFNESHLGCGVVRYGDKRVNETDEGPVGDVCSNWNVPVAPHEVADTEIISWPTAIELFRPDVILAHVSSWDVADRIVPGVVEDWASIGDPAYDAYVLEEYTVANEVLGASGADVYWMMSPYLNRGLLPEDHEDRVDGINALVSESIETVVTATGASITEIDYPGWIGPVGEARDADLRDDGVHLTQAGLDEIAPWLLSAMGLS
ncbi:MAG: acyltransferase [Acidimicrobiales bacterium]|nr:MAG: acyltransferase [Acidimicrobiales bacterium]